MKNKNNSAIIDDLWMDEDKVHLTIYHGKSFRKGPLFTAFFLMLLGILILYNISTGDNGARSKFNPDGNNDYVFYLFIGVGLFFIVAGSFVFFSKTGVQIDLKKKKIRNFVQFILKTGSWQSFEKYPFISVIKIQKRTRYGGGFGGNFRYYGTTGPSVILENDEFEICLLNNTHYKRITLDISTNHEVAMEKMNQLANKLNLEIVTFKPFKLSESMKKILRLKSFGSH